MSLKKAGTFAATITLEHLLHEDVALTGSEFQVNKLAKKNLRFPKLTLAYRNNITEQDLLRQVTGLKDGYTVKGIRFVSSTDVAELTGAAKNALYVKKAGSFAATLTLEHPIFGDETIIGAEFEIRNPFRRLRTPFKQRITAAEINAQLQELTGYTLKSITGIEPVNAAALTGATKTDLQLKTVGTFRATLTVQKPSNIDIVIGGAEFEITKLRPPTVTLSKMTTYKSLITREDILAELTGGTLEANTYVRILNIKEISGSGVVELSGSVPIKIKKQTGIFSADLILRHPNYVDQTLTGVVFEKEQAFVFDKSSGTITGVTPKYKTYFKTATSATFPDEIEGVRVTTIRPTPTGRGNIFGDTTTIQGVGYNTSIKTIHLPRYLHTLGNGAFWNCRGVVSMDLPPSIKVIEYFAFYKTSDLRSVNLHNVEQIETKAFEGSGIESVHIPASAQNIGRQAFRLCYRLKHVTIAEGITYLSREMFYYCGWIHTITIPRSLSDFKPSALKGSSRAVVTMKRATNIGGLSAWIAGDFFDDIKTIVVPRGTIAAYKSVLQRKWHPKIKEEALLSELVTYKHVITQEDVLEALKGSSLEKYSTVQFSNIQEIGGSGFTELSGTSVIKVKKQAATFKANVLLKHPSYADMTLTGVTFSKERAFAFDKNTKTIWGTTAKYNKYFNSPECTSIVFPDEISGVKVKVIESSNRLTDNGFTIHYPFLNTKLTYNRLNKVPEYRNTNIKTVHLPKHLERLGKSVFLGYEALTTIQLPRSLKEIDNRAFYGCKALKSINVEDTSLETLGEEAFAETIALESIELPGSLRNIGKGAFYWSAIQSLKLQEGITTIGEQMFTYCGNLTSVDFPQSLREIKSSAFSLTALNSIQLGPNVNTIGASAFSGVNIKSLQLPSSLRIVGEKAFSDCSFLKSVKLSQGITAISKGMFENCRELIHLNIPATVTTLSVDGLNSTSLSLVVAMESRNGVSNVDPYFFDYVKTIFIPQATLYQYIRTLPSKWHPKLKESTYAKRVATYRNVLTQEIILDIIQESVMESEKYSAVRISNIQEIGGSGFTELTGGASIIKVKKQAATFRADVLLRHPTYTDKMLTGVTFVKEQAFVFNKNTKTITGITLPYRTKMYRFQSLVFFPDEIEGVRVEQIHDSRNVSIFSDLTANFEDRVIKNIRLPRYLKKIGTKTFYKCLALTAIKAPQTLTDIGVEAFYGAANLTSFNIPNSVRRLRKDVFSRCTKLNIIMETAAGIGHFTSGVDSGFFNDVKTIVIPKGSMAAWINIGNNAWKAKLREKN